MWEIFANQLLPKALKSCPKSKKSPDLVTLLALHFFSFREGFFSKKNRFSHTLGPITKNLFCRKIRLSNGTFSFQLNNFPPIAFYITLHVSFKYGFIIRAHNATVNFLQQ